jgi:hypothetical protein
MKRSIFLSKITKARPAAKRKVRRPSRKLAAANLSALAAALPEVDEEDFQATEGKIKHKSLKSRPGALKRKEKLVRGEVERFRRSMGQLMAMQGEKNGDAEMEIEDTASSKDEGAAAAPSAPTAPTSSRFAALRGFITATMERNPAFVSSSK